MVQPAIERVGGAFEHEAVVYFSDKEVGLRGFIALHSTKPGPAVGGTRYFAYRKESDALQDVLRLSRAMTYKCALAGVPYGGGKAVIIADPNRPKSKGLLKAYARKINLLRGTFYTGEDVGLTFKDVGVMASASPYIIGRKNLAGDLGPWAALGVLGAIQVAVKQVYGSSGLRRRTFAIKGLGKVGLSLSRLIYRLGGMVYGSDIDRNAIRQARRLCPTIRIVDPVAIHRQPVDVYSPCALGGDLNWRTIVQLRCKIVCGGANNQLGTTRDGHRIFKRGILYIPDYLANAGGLINVVDELRRGGYNRNRVVRNIEHMRGTVKKILELSQQLHLPTSLVADQQAEEILSKR